MKKFVIRTDPQYDDESVEYIIPSYYNLEQVSEAFTNFLKACGYQLDGQHVIIDHYDDLK